MATSSTTAAAALLFFLLLATFASAAHNITNILAPYPEYSVYSHYLSLTKVADEINSRETVTILILPNAAISALADKRPLAAVKSALRLLTLLDYYDTAKLHKISDGTVLTSTLLQTTGNAAGNLGFVNITNLRGGKVGFGSSSPGSKLDTTYTKSVKQIPFSISVLEVSAPILYPGLLDAPTKDSANITGLLYKAGCKTFADLIVSSGVLKMYKKAMDTGLTVFAPNDMAFDADGVPNLSTLSEAEIVTLLQYHAVPQYAPKSSLQITKGKLPTLATNAAGNYTISVGSTGNDVSLRTALDTSRVASTVLDDTPLCILTVDSVLLPVELFGIPPAPAPAPAPASTEAPIPALAPAPSLASPPSLPESPAPDVTADAVTKDSSSTVDGRWPSIFSVLVAVFAGMML